MSLISFEHQGDEVGIAGTGVEFGGALTAGDGIGVGGSHVMGTDVGYTGLMPRSFSESVHTSINVKKMTRITKLVMAVVDLDKFKTSLSRRLERIGFSPLPCLGRPDARVLLRCRG